MVIYDFRKLYIELLQIARCISSIKESMELLRLLKLLEAKKIGFDYFFGTVIGNKIIDSNT